MFLPIKKNYAVLNVHFKVSFNSFVIWSSLSVSDFKVVSHTAPNHVVTMDNLIPKRFHFLPGSNTEQNHLIRAK